MHILAWSCMRRLIPLFRDEAITSSWLAYCTLARHRGIQLAQKCSYWNPKSSLINAFHIFNFLIMCKNDMLWFYSFQSLMLS